MFALMENCLRENKEGLYFSLNPLIASYHCAIFPIVKKEEMLEFSKEVESLLKDSWFDVFYDKSGSLGRRYARQDEIGTPFCVTFDFESLEDEAVTIRHRDSMEQERVAIDKLRDYFESQIDQ